MGQAERLVKRPSLDEGVKERSGGGGGNWEAGARGGCRAGARARISYAIRYPISRVVPRAAPCVPRPRPRAVFSLIHVDSACIHATMRIAQPSREPTAESAVSPRTPPCRNTPRPSNRSPYGAARARRARRAARPKPSVNASPSSPGIVRPSKSPFPLTGLTAEGRRGISKIMIIARGGGTVYGA